jgi:hypothetical protein
LGVRVPPALQEVLKVLQIKKRLEEALND